MRVMCINDNWKPEPTVAGRPTPKVGDIDEVIDEKELGGYHWFFLAGYWANQGFKATHFATLPSVTSEEVEEETREAIIM